MIVPFCGVLFVKDVLSSLMLTIQVLLSELGFKKFCDCDKGSID